MKSFPLIFLNTISAPYTCWLSEVNLLLIVEPALVISIAAASNDVVLDARVRDGLDNRTEESNGASLLDDTIDMDLGWISWSASSVSLRAY
jgi:hypothetical protein